MRQILSSLILTLVIAVFSSCAAPEEKATSSPAPSAAANGGWLGNVLPSSHESAAREYFLKEWEQKFRKCGDRYYGCMRCDLVEHSANKILAIKTSPSQWTIEPLTPSEADKANNIKWYCDLTLVATMSSYYDKKERQWSQQYDGTLALWILSYLSIYPSKDIPIIFQVVEYQNGSHNFFFSNKYQENLDARYLGDKLSFEWNNIKLIDSCSEIPEASK